LQPLTEKNMATAPAGPRTDLDLTALRAALENSRASLEDEIRDLNSLDETGGPDGERQELAGYDQHQADSGTETFQRSQDEAIMQNARGSLRNVEEALRRMDDGTYGYCERCATEIARERLEILPEARFCLPCADDLQDRD